MFKDKTFENILQQMLDRVTNDVDKREGSIIYDALAPAAYFLADEYYQLRNYIDLLFADTAVGEYLDRCVADIGMTRLPATAAERKVTTSGPIDIGSIWGINGINYTIEEVLEENVYMATCNTPGDVGNQYSGELQPVSGNATSKAILGDIITAGTDQESDDALRSRYQRQVQLQPASGNPADYLKWAGEVAGVGGAKVFPLWAGNGTVKVVIIDTNYSVNEGLEAAVKEHIDNERNIGATVTVDSPAKKTINVTAQISISSSTNVESVKEAFTGALTDYLKGIVVDYYGKIDTDPYRVSVGAIGNILFDIAGVEDYENLTVNGGLSNILINNTEIPVVGTISLTEAGG